MKNTRTLTLSASLLAALLLLGGCAGSTNKTTAASALTAGQDAAAASDSRENSVSAAPGISSGSQSSGDTTSGAISSPDGSSEAPGTAKAVAGGTDSEEAIPEMIFIHNTSMTATGREAILAGGADSLTYDGSIRQCIPSSETPAANDQANFDCTNASYALLDNGAACVMLGDQPMLFLAEDTVEFQGVFKKKSQLSADTLRWLDFYYSLSDGERDALSMIPTEFMNETLIFAEETSGESDPDISYLQALSPEELELTETLAQKYFTEDVPSFEGVDQIYPLDSDSELYHNSGLEDEYAPGDIVIYRVLTVRDRRDGNPFRFISIARRSKSDDWKIINSGY